tara:strand:- start:832 stop:1068 length:237 start_codon:yes stop_codon:yes gene_type:complete
MIRRIYQNGYADGGIVPVGTFNVSSFPQAPDVSKKRILDSYPIMRVGAMELQRIANESLKRKKKRNVDAFADFINKNF